MERKLKMRIIGECLVIEIPLRRIHKLPEMALPDLDVDLQVIRMRPQKRRVLSELLTGKSNKEIAKALNVCERTVKFHVSDILQRLKVRSRGEVFCYFQGRNVEIVGQR